jgi:four helix bundle protein
MLRIYPVVLEVLKELQPVLRRIEGRDSDLGRQLRRCSASIALNLGEGMYSRGRNRQVRYHTALGSARETLSCLEVAVVFGYVVELTVRSNDHGLGVRIEHVRIREDGCAEVINERRTIDENSVGPNLKVLTHGGADTPTNDGLLAMDLNGCWSEAVERLVSQHAEELRTVCLATGIATEIVNVRISRQEPLGVKRSVLYVRSTHGLSAVEPAQELPSRDND